MRTIVSVRTAFIIFVFCAIVLENKKAYSESSPEMPTDLENIPTIENQESIDFAGLKLTGLPLLGGDSDNGVYRGIGLVFTYYEEDYAPFRYQIYTQFFETSLGFESHMLRIEVLKFAGTRLRLQTSFGITRTLNAQHYGYGNYQDIQRNQAIQEGRIAINENTPPIRDIYQVPGFQEEFTINESLLSGQINNSLNPGRRVLRERQNKYFNYDRIRRFFEASTEDWIGDTNFKWFTGIRLQRYRINSYYGDFDAGEAEANSRTLIDIQQPEGYDATEKPRYINGLRMAIAYDSRPRIRENNPNSGIFADFHYEGAGKQTGSNYTFEKITMTWRQYIELFPLFFNRSERELVFAYRILGHRVFGDIPFFEKGRIYTMREFADGLGGSGGLRGFPANQFVDYIMVMSNNEFRFTAFHSSILGGIDFIFIAYHDIGRAAPETRELKFNNLHHASGGGIRLVWQRNTIINITAGRSDHEENYNFAFNHMF